MTLIRAENDTDDTEKRPRSVSRDTDRPHIVVRLSPKLGCRGLACRQTSPRTGVGGHALNRRRGHRKLLRFARFVHKPSQESQLRRTIGGIGPNARRRQGIQLFEDVGFIPTT